MNSSVISDALFTKTQQRVLGLLYGNTNPNKFSLLPSPKGEGQDEGIHITTFWDWYYLRSWFDKLTHERNHTLPFLLSPFDRTQESPVEGLGKMISTLPVR